MKDNQLYFTKMPSVFLWFTLLESVDREIILRILHSPKGAKRISFRTLSEKIDFSSGKKVGLAKLQYSVRKLLFMGLITKRNIIKNNGQDGTNLYEFNYDRNLWVLYHSLRRVVNKEEESRKLPLSRNLGDLSEHYHWILAFERTLPNSLRRFVDDKGSVLKKKSVLLDKISKEADFVNRLESGDNFNTEPLHKIEDLLEKMDYEKNKKVLKK